MKPMLAALVALAGATASPGLAQDGPIENVIASQIEAFQADDFERAFAFASPSIRQLFGTPERFGQMVRQGYPMVYRPANVDYLDLRDAGSVKRQRVMMRDGTGAVHVLEYEMIEVDGTWQINGVRMVPASQVGV